MVQEKTLTNIVLSLLLLTMGSSQLEAKDKWGTPTLNDKYRPQQAWIQKFSETPDVVAGTSIAEAIESCDEIVGSNHYCTIEVNGDETDFPLEIFRSKTKIVGVEDMAPLTSSKNGIFIYIGDKTQKVILEGLNIQGHNAGEDEIYGIVVEGSKIKKIAILNNTIYDFNSNSDAHGIAVYGTGKGGKNSIKHILIKGNEVHDMRTGSSESIVINGNVQRWEISENDVYDVNNIAIDAIGGEGTSPAGKNKKGRVLPGKTDAARYGFIENNYVENMHTTDNPAYDNEESWAAAIYVDGAHHINIANNMVVNTPWGYEIGAENCVVSRNITMIGNSSDDAYYGDLVLGGYAKKGFKADKSINCNPNNTQDANEGHGYVKFLTIKDNSFNTLSGEEESVTLQYRTTNAVISQEGVEAVNETGNGSAKGDQNAVRIGSSVSVKTAPNAPYSLTKFQDVLDKSDLHWQSSINGSFNILKNMEGVVTDYFYLSNNGHMTFKIADSGQKRVELRQKNTWTPELSNVKMSGKIKCDNPDNLYEYTFMQVFNYSRGKPSARLIWDKKRKNKTNNLWAFVKTDAGERKVDLGANPSDLFDVEVSIVNFELVIKINDVVKLTQNIENDSYWNSDLYFKAGAYVSGSKNNSVPEGKKATKTEFDSLNFYRTDK